MENKKEKRKNIRIRMKGLWMPRVFASFIGWMHRKKGLLKENGRAHIWSLWLERKQRDFESYSGKLYTEIGHHLKEMRKQQSMVYQELLELEQHRRDLEAHLPTKEPETIEEKRQADSLTQQIRAAKDQCSKKSKDLKLICIEIEDTEHELLETIHSTKSRAEALMLAYLQGAGKYVDAEALLHKDLEAWELYETYCSNHFDYNPLMCEDEKEVEAYV